MVKEIDIKVPPEKISDPEYLQQAIQKKFKKYPSLYHIILKRSIDARGDQPVYVLRVRVSNEDNLQADDQTIEVHYQTVSNRKEVIIIGAGPAGYFAALQCLELGYRPTILERGKDVRARRRDLKSIQQDGIVNPHSNYCFGEGGAGTYSDGKLYTRSKKRGKIIKILKILVDHGAPQDILIDAHPHIGSNKLPNIITNIRSTIEEHGGEVLFDHHVTDLVIHQDQCQGVEVNHDKIIKGDHYILATGHSARDIFQLLDSKSIHIEAKDFALGIRIEHPQELIDEIQYNQHPRHEALPAASYSVVSQINDIGVFSFCMCPGGLIVPAATAPGEIVVNGMSLSRRDSPFANSGIVTSISTAELNSYNYEGTFASMNFQSEVEQSLFNYGDGSQKAPAQNLVDFTNGLYHLDLNPSSYIPGLYKAPLHELLPNFVYERLKLGLISFSRKLNGYFTDEANVVAIESRTSSPVRIPRDNVSCAHVDIKNLYPCGEGAGYAGGILSAAMDGQRVVQAIGKSA